MQKKNFSIGSGHLPPFCHKHARKHAHARRKTTHDAEEVPVGGAYVNLRLDQRLPLLDERAELVAGEVHAVEVRQDRGALDVLTAKLNLPVPLKRDGTIKRKSVGNNSTM